MTADTTALQESIARALAPSHRHPLKPEACNGCRRLRDSAAAVLPIIRAAQADAWDEGWRQGAFLGVTTPNPYRTTETGDQA